VLRGIQRRRIGEIGFGKMNFDLIGLGLVGSTTIRRFSGETGGQRAQVQVLLGDWFRRFEPARLRSSQHNYSGTERSAGSAEHSIKLKGN
jgi:hypothetical protein